MNICPGGSLFFRYWIHPRKKPHEKDLPCTTCTKFLKLKIDFFNDPTRTPLHNIEYTVKGFPIKVDIKSDVTSLNVDGDKTDYIKNAEPLDIGNNLVRFLWKKLRRFSKLVLYKKYFANKKSDFIMNN